MGVMISPQERGNHLPFLGETGSLSFTPRQSEALASWRHSPVGRGFAWFCCPDFALTAALALLALALPLRAAEGFTRLDAMPGAGHKVRIEGTSSVHDWQMEGPLIGGHVEAGPNFPIEPGQEIKPGKVEARVESFIPVHSLKSIEKDGKPYSDGMNNVVYEHLKEETNKFIRYLLNELVLKEAPKTKDAPYVMDAKGELIVAGVTNKISMPVNVTPLGDRKVRITGATSVKMTDFSVEPPSPKGFGLLIKTGDEVKLSFDWVVGQKTAPAASK